MIFRGRLCHLGRLGRKIVGVTQQLEDCGARCPVGKCLHGEGPPAAGLGRRSAGCRPTGLPVHVLAISNADDKKCLQRRPFDEDLEFQPSSPA